MSQSPPPPPPPPSHSTSHLHHSHHNHHHNVDHDHDFERYLTALSRTHSARVNALLGEIDAHVHNTQNAQQQLEATQRELRRVQELLNAHIEKVEDMHFVL